MPSATPIVVLDSGLGGLTVARAIHAAVPHEDIVYFGDTARLPYGSKTADTVGTFVKQIIAHLRPLNPRHVVIACNTATALALPAARAAGLASEVLPGLAAEVLLAGAVRCASTPCGAVIASAIAGTSPSKTGTRIFSPGCTSRRPSLARSRTVSLE